MTPSWISLGVATVVAATVAIPTSHGFGAVAIIFALMVLTRVLAFREGRQSALK